MYFSLKILGQNNLEATGLETMGVGIHSKDRTDQEHRETQSG